MFHRQAEGAFGIVRINDFVVVRQVQAKKFADGFVVIHDQQSSHVHLLRSCYLADEFPARTGISFEADWLGFSESRTSRTFWIRASSEKGL